MTTTSFDDALVADVTVLQVMQAWLASLDEKKRKIVVGAYEAGMAAADAGLPASACPHEDGLVMTYWWQGGHSDVREHG